MNQRNKFKEISDKLFPQLENTAYENRQLIIAFSGVPGSGKSTISRQIKERYNGVLMGNDRVRVIIEHSKTLSTNPEEDERLLQDYNEHFLRKYSFINKLLILDKSLDRQYTRFFPIFEELRLKYFVIRLEIEKGEAIERIMKRKTEDPVFVRTTMERWQREFANFGKNSHYDISLAGSAPDTALLFAKLDNLILC